MGYLRVTSAALYAHRTLASFRTLPTYQGVHCRPCTATSDAFPARSSRGFAYRPGPEGAERGKSQERPGGRSIRVSVGIRPPDAPRRELHETQSSPVDPNQGGPIMSHASILPRRRRN